MAEPTSTALALKIGIPLAFKGVQGFLEDRHNKQEANEQERVRRIQALIQQLSPGAGAGMVPPTGSAPGLGMSALTHFNRSVSDPLIQHILPQLFNKIG